ncbi:MAG: hypothetical protein AAF393_07340 [Pseudomonadota bacterium]
MSLSDNWDSFEDSLKAGVRQLSKATFGEVLSQAENDADRFVKETGERLRRWGNALANGLLTKDEFEDLVAGRKDLAKMHALKSLGKSQAALERFRTGLISLVINSAFDAIGL